MLASPGERLADLDDAAWVYEPKLDGARCIAMIGTAGTVTLVGRRGTVYNEQFPEVVADLERHFPKPIILDGELVVRDPASGIPDFSKLATRLHVQDKIKIRLRVNTMPAEFVAFDVLQVGEHPGPRFQRFPLSARRHALELIFEISTNGTRTTHVSMIEQEKLGNGARLFADVVARGGEGIIAKRRESPYDAGRRSPDWRKFKRHEDETFWVMGFTEGTGSRAATFGAAIIGTEPTGGLLVGEVGSGFDQSTLVKLLQLTRDGTRVPIDVAFQERTPDGRLRFPVFKRIRYDLMPQGG